MKIIDIYIIKKFIKTFLTMFLLFIPIGILVDVSEKVDKFKEHDLSFNQILEYYLDFIWYYGYFLVPIFVFLSVIWFTSKLSSNSEVIAILSSGISFKRYNNIPHSPQLHNLRTRGFYFEIIISIISNY